MTKCRTNSNLKLLKIHIKNNIMQFLFLTILLLTHIILIKYFGELKYTPDILLVMIPLLGFHSCIKAKKYSNFIIGIIVIFGSALILAYKIYNLRLEENAIDRFLIEVSLFTGIVLTLSSIVESAKKIDKIRSKNDIKKHKNITKIKHTVLYKYNSCYIHKK